MSIKSRNFGEAGGKRVDAFTLTSDTGVEVDIINYGVVVRDWKVPVTGGSRGVVLGFDDFPSYLSHSPHFGALAGRVANRIAGARFTLDGKTYDLTANEHGNILHGGPEGLGLLVHAVRRRGDGLDGALQLGQVRRGRAEDGEGQVA